MDKTYEDDLIERILSTFNLEEILEIQDIDAEELVERYRSEIIDNKAVWEGVL